MGGSAARAAAPSHARRLGRAERLARLGLTTLFAAVVVGVVHAPAARAQGPIVVWTAGSTAASGRAELWARRVARGLEREDVVIAETTDAWAHATGIARERVDRVADIERAIAEAHALAAAVEEGAALVRLMDAEVRARDVIDVPGAVAWYAEVELELATLAHQLGEPALARACLARAAALAPDRALEAAEAPPELVALHDEARRAERARSASAVTVAAGVEGATVYVDDQLVGASPARVRVRSGTHALRVVAPGHLPWARLVEISPGARPDIEVTLSPEPAVALAREARSLAEDLRLGEIPHVLGALAAEGHAPRALVLVVAGSGVLDRALAFVCIEGGCRRPVRLEGTEAAALATLEEAAWLEADAEPAMLAWLDEPLPIGEVPPPPVEWWQEWWPWATLGAVAAGGLAVGLGVGLYEPPARGLTVVVTFEP